MIVRKLLKAFKDKIYCTQGSYAFLVLSLYYACLAFYYTSLFLIIFFLYSISSNWNGYQVQHKQRRQCRVAGISISSRLSFQLSQHGTVFRVPLRGMFAPMLILTDPSCAMVIAKAVAQLQDNLRTPALQHGPSAHQTAGKFVVNRVAGARAELSSPIDEWVKWIQIFLFFKLASSLFSWDIAGSRYIWEVMW